MSAEWKTIRLHEVASIRNGAGIKQENFRDVGIPLVRVTNFTDTSVELKDCVKVSVEHAPKWKGHQLKCGDILVATVGSWPPNWSSVVGKSVSVPATAVGSIQNQNTCCIQAKPNLADQRFLYYLTRSAHFGMYAANSASGSANQARLPVAKLEAYEFALPPLLEQISIGQTLGAFDDRIALLRETNATLEAMAQALFKSWFVDFDPVHANAGTRAATLPAELQAMFPSTFTDTPQGQVPEGWRVACLGDICQIASGKRPEIRSDLESEGARVPLYGGAGIMGYTDKPLFDEKKILTGRVGTLGKVHIATPPFWASDNVLVLTPRNKSNFYFSLNWLLSIDVKALNRGSTQPLLTQKDLGAQQRVLPSNEILAEFENMAGELYLKIHANTQQTQTLATLRDTLLPRLISGQLRLPDAEAAMAEAGA